MSKTFIKYKKERATDDSCGWLEGFVCGINVCTIELPSEYRGGYNVYAGFPTCNDEDHVGIFATLREAKDKANIVILKKLLKFENVIAKYRKIVGELK